MEKAGEVRMLAGDWLNNCGNPLICEAFFARIDNTETTEAKNVAVNKADAKNRITTA
jgi:hypothetical protein